MYTEISGKWNIYLFLGYNNTKSDLSTTSEAVKVYHRLVEAFKWSYARRALLGDPSFVPKENITRVRYS